MREGRRILCRRRENLPDCNAQTPAPGQDFFIRAHDSLMKGAKNASLTRDQWFYVPTDIAFLSLLRRILAIRCFSYCFSGKNS
jgi:hypothetical protein